MSDTPENPPPITTEASEGTISLRDTWPKTKHEREAAKKLVLECYNLAHDDKNQIQWNDSRISEQWNKLMYWAADDQINVHQLAHQMRHAGLLPKVLRVNGNYAMRNKRVPASDVTHTRKGNVIDPKFAEVDAWMKKHGPSLPKKAPRFKCIDWDKVKDENPEIWGRAVSIWGKDARASWHRRSSEMGFIEGKGYTYKKADKPVRHTVTHTGGGRRNPQDTAALDAYMQEHWQEFPRSVSGGSIKWKKLVHEDAQLVALARQNFPTASLKSLALLLWRRFKIVIGKAALRTGHAVVRHTPAPQTAPAPRPAPASIPQRPQVDSLTAHVAAIFTGEEATDFRFTVCPRCLAPLDVIERMTGSPVLVCPKCEFPVLKAAQGVAARLAIP